MKLSSDHVRVIALAAACAVAAAAIHVATLYVPALASADIKGYFGFLGLQTSRTLELGRAVVSTADPLSYALLLAAVLAYGVRVRGPRAAAATGAAILAADLTSQLLKAALSSPRPGLVEAHSWPSGHMTAAMTLVLALVLLSPSRWRAPVAVLGGLYAVAMGYSLPLLASHYPSDVLGAVAIAAGWMSLAAAALPAAERPWPAAPAGRRPVLRDLLPSAHAFAVLAALAVGVAFARPRTVLDYAADHTTFVACAWLIGIAAVVVATAGAMRRPGPN